MKKVMAIVFIFVVRFALNIFLPSFDTYSDANLAYKTFTFSLGESLLLSGCRVCQGKDETEIYTLKTNSCQSCLISRSGYDHTECGNSHEVLNKIHELERKDTCENENLSFTLNMNLATKDYIFKNETCDFSEDSNVLKMCCVKYLKSKYNSRLIDTSTKYTYPYPTSMLGYKKNKLIYNTYLLSGGLSLVHCERVFHEYFSPYVQSFYAYVNNNITSLKSPLKAQLLLRFTKSRNGKISLENGYTNVDGCGILLQKKRDDSKYSNNPGWMCGRDSCLVHLLNLKFNLNISSLDDWKSNTFYDYGVKVGGQTCQLLWKYGLVMLVPIFLNMAFNSLVFFEDLSNGKVTMVEIVFVPLLFYPQWKTIRLLVTFIYDRNEDKLCETRDKLDREVGVLEPFLESAIQVS